MFYKLLTVEIYRYLGKRWDELFVDDVFCFSVLNRAGIRTIAQALRLDLSQLSAKGREVFDEMLFAPNNLGRFGLIPEDKERLDEEYRDLKRLRLVKYARAILNSPSTHFLIM